MTRGKFKVIGGVVLSTVMALGMSSLTTFSAYAATNHAVRHAIASPIHLTMVVYGSSLDQKTYQQRADMYTKLHPNVVITVKLLTGNYDQEVETMIAGGDAPDIMETSQDTSGLGVKGAISNLNSYIARAHMNLKQEFPGYVNQYKYKGAQYAIPDRGGYMIMYYNKKMFNAAHLAYPSPNWTWKQFLNDARKLTINKNGRTVQWGLSIDQWWPKYGSFVHEVGGHMLNARETQSLLNTAPVRNALIFYKQFMYKYAITPTPNEWANLGAGITADALFGQGKAALMPTGFWDIATFNKEHLDYGITTMPMQRKGGTTAVGTGLAVVSKTHYPQIAFNAIQYMTSAAGEMPIVTNKEDIPANAQTEKAYYNQTLKGLVAPQTWTMMKSEVFSPKVPPTWNQWQTLIGDALGQYFDNKLSYQKMATEVDQQSINTLAGVQ